MQKAVQSIQGNVLIIIFIALTILAFALVAKDINTSPSEEYQSVIVEEGDTLWGLAKTYQTSDIRNTNDFVSWVEKVNHLNQDFIVPGQEILIPVRQS